MQLESLDNNKPEALLYRPYPAYMPEDLGYKMELVPGSTDLGARILTESPICILTSGQAAPAEAESAGTLYRVAEGVHGRDLSIELPKKERSPHYPEANIKGSPNRVDWLFAGISPDPATGVRLQGIFLSNQDLIRVTLAKSKELKDCGILTENLIGAVLVKEANYTEIGPDGWNRKRIPFPRIIAYLIEDQNQNIDIGLRYSMQAERWGVTAIDPNEISDIMQQGESKRDKPLIPAVLARLVQVNARIRDLAQCRRCWSFV